MIRLSMGVTGTAALNDANGLLSTWTALYAASETTTGAKTSTEKENLAGKLHVALLTIALQKATEASTLKKAVTDADSQTTATLYFREDLLVDVSEVEEEEPEPPAPPVP